MRRPGHLLLAAALVTLVPLTAGCRAAEEREAPAPPTDAADTAGIESPASPASPADAADPLLNTVWVRQDPGAPPGDLRIFLADGTLVIDSCWEVYALHRWRRTGADGLVMEEDLEVPARILELGPGELRLELSLVGGERQAVAYRRAEVPYVCPEMAR